MVDRWADRRAGRASGAMPHARRASMPARASASPDEVWRGERDVRAHLQHLGVRAAGIESDLVNLQRSLTYQLLFDGERVSGVTLARLEPVARAVDELWLGFGVLNEVLAEAAQVVGNGVRPDLDDPPMMEGQPFRGAPGPGAPPPTPPAPPPPPPPPPPPTPPIPPL